MKLTGKKQRKLLLNILIIYAGKINYRKRAKEKIKKIIM
jgi:hypothetical protein